MNAPIFAVPHLERTLPDASMLAGYYVAALLVKDTLPGLPLGWVFWRQPRRWTVGARLPFQASGRPVPP
jgi:hypothetical protein